MADSNKLNARQHRFCLNILAGMRPQEAYAKAGYSDNPVNLATRPYDILQEAPQVRAFIEEKRRLKEAVILAHDINNTIASPQERKQILTEIVRSEYQVIEETERSEHKRTTRVKRRDPVAAIQELNKMDGSYVPSKHLVGHKVQFEVVHRQQLAEDIDEEVPRGENGDNSTL